MAEQKTEISYFPAFGQGVLIYSNKTCTAEIPEDLCREAKAMAAEIQAVYRKIGEAVGPNDLVASTCTTSYIQAARLPRHRGNTAARVRSTCAVARVKAPSTMKWDTPSSTITSRLLGILKSGARTRGLP